MDETLKRQVLDEEHLRLLGIGYWVFAGVSGFFSLFGLLYGLMGAFMVSLTSGIFPAPHQSPPEAVGWFMALFGLGFTLAMLCLAALKVGVARCLKRRRARIFCLIVAGICCLGLPYGTVLGVLTFLVLGRPTVSRMFAPATPAEAEAGVPGGAASQSVPSE